MTLNIGKAALLLVLLVVSGLMLAAARQPDIIIKAERFKYTPNIIELKAGAAVNLHITSQDVLHGFSIPTLKIRTDLEPNKTVVVSIPPLSVGEYPIVCDIFCGTNHSSMSARLVVK
jgi:cytochrome c oxidase subunit 2